MSAIPGWMLRHQITVEAYQGDSAYGPQYADPVTVACFLEEKTRLIRAKDGREVVSSSAAYCPIGTTAPAGSQVTLPDGRTTTVLAALQHDARGLPTPDHLELQLQ